MGFWSDFWALRLAVGSFLLVQGSAIPMAPVDMRGVSTGQVASERGPVAVPAPSALAEQRYRSGAVLWVVDQLWALAVPGLLLFTGFSARMRTWSDRISRRWPIALAMYVVLFLTLTFTLDLPLAYYQGFVRPHAYALSNQSFGRWFGNVLKSLVVGGNQSPPPIRLPGIIAGYLTLALLYLLLRISPRRWWLYAAMCSLPMAVCATLILPIWVAPLFNHFGPMQDRALEARILELAERAGIDGARVYEVDKSRDTNAVNAYVTGILGTKRIVLWDTALAQLDERELMTVMGHEMGHYVLGHVTAGILFSTGLLLASLYLVSRTANWLIQRFQRRFGFDQLSDIASWPLILLLVNLCILLFAPLSMAFSRHQEHEADRFALEITRDNHAAGTAFVELQERNLYIPRPSWFPELWRATHPSLGQRIDFANEYRPWETGQPAKYAHLFR